MGDHKVASQERRIEASEQERASLGAFLNSFSPDNRHDRQLCEALHADFDLDTAREHLFAAVKERGEATVAELCAADLAEYATTNQVIDYMLKIVDTKIPRNLGRHIHTLEMRALALKEGSYTAQSAKAASAAATDAPAAHSGV